MSITALNFIATTSDFTTNLSPPINLDINKCYEAALLSIDVYNSIPNVTKENNKFEYSTDAGKSWKTISLNIGAYQLDQINEEIHRHLIANDDYDKENKTSYIEIVPNIPELKSVMKITNPQYRVNFDVENSIGKLLGFPSGIISYGYSTSENIVKILSINSILVNTDFITGDYCNGTLSSAIYSFDHNRVPPGFKIQENPNLLTYCPVNKSVIYSIRIWLTDQDGKLVDFRGETITIRLAIREVESIEVSIINAVKKLKRENVL